MVARLEVSRLRALGASTRLALGLFVADPQWMIPSTLAPAVFAIVTFFLLEGQGPYFVLYAILGATMLCMWGQTLYGSGWATGQDRAMGTLEPTLAAPPSYLWIVMGRVVWNVVIGLIGAVISIAVIALAYGQPIPLSNPVGFLLALLLAILSLSSVGILFAAAFVYTRYAGFIQNVGEFAFYVGTGAMFPIILLPFWSNPISLLFPPTWAVDAWRIISIPGYVGLPWGLAGDLAGAIGTTAVYLAIAGSVFRRVERHVLEQGDLGDW